MHRAIVAVTVLILLAAAGCKSEVEETSTVKEGPATLPAQPASEPDTRPAAASQPVQEVTTQLAPEPVPVAASLEDTEWVLVEIDGEDVVHGPEGKTPRLVLLSADGRVAGNGGVNNFSGSYKLDGDSLTFGQTMSTMMAGPPEMMEQETAVLTALGRTASWEIAENVLHLRDADGGVLARFEPVKTP